MKISILIPVYNTSKYLERCLNSIINQNFKDIEIICVNDGSTDNSLEILRKYEAIDERVIIINKKNGGLSSARNEALKKAKGEYCLNIDSDDWIEPKYLEEMYEKAKKENLDMLISDIIFDYGYKKEIKKDLNIENNKILNGEEYLKSFFKDNFMGYTWNKLIKKKYYNDYNIKHNEEIFLFEDVEVIAKLAFHMKRIGKLNKSYYHYIQGENNGSKKINFKNYLDIEKCFMELEGYFKKNFQQLIFSRKIYTLLLNLLYNNYVKDKIYYKKRNELLKILKKEKKFLNKELIVAKSAKIYLFLNVISFFESLKKIVIFIRKMKKEINYRKLKLKYINIFKK